MFRMTAPPSSTPVCAVKRNQLLIIAMHFSGDISSEKDDPIKQRMAGMGVVWRCVWGRGDGWLTIITTRGYRYTSPCGRAERKRGRDSDVREKVRMGCSEEWKREERVFKQIENFVTAAKSFLHQRQLSLISSISERVAQRDVWMFLNVATVQSRQKEQKPVQM